MITTIVIGAIVLWAVVSLSKRFGFRTVMDVATMLFLAAPVVWFAAMIVSSLLHGVKGPGLSTWAVIALVVVVVAWVAAKQVGWGMVLGVSFTATMLVCGLIAAATMLLVGVFGSAHGGH
jgi:hypothetical protein